MSTTTAIAITPGEPAGIGPDILLSYLNAQPNTVTTTPLVAIADRDMLLARAQQLQISLRCHHYDETLQQLNPIAANELFIWHQPLAAPIKPGIAATKNAQSILQTLTLATQGCLTGQFNALVTGPVDKSIINQAGIPFSGHTEFLAKLTQTPQTVMMLQTAELKVALLTTHIPLSAVPKAVTTDKLITVIKIIHHELQQRFQIAQPRIMVCGLNPHAGEGGHMGHEEQTVIIPALKRLRTQGYCVLGPVPADTAFTLKHLQHADVVLALYHDQGLPVLKHLGFHRAVNITLGLPFIRTSVDHGTAFDLAGTGTADHSSLAAAIALATQQSAVIKSDA